MSTANTRHPRAAAGFNKPSRQASAEASNTGAIAAGNVRGRAALIQTKTQDELATTGTGSLLYDFTLTQHLFTELSQSALGHGAE